MSVKVVLETRLLFFLGPVFELAFSQLVYHAATKLVAIRPEARFRLQEEIGPGECGVMSYFITDNMRH